MRVPASLLAEVDRHRRRSGESRSAVVRRALERLLDATAEADAVRQYVEAYRRAPPDAKDAALSTPSVEELILLAQEYPWDETPGDRSN